MQQQHTPLNNAFFALFFIALIFGCRTTVKNKPPDPPKQEITVLPEIIIPCPTPQEILIEEGTNAGLSEKLSYALGMAESEMTPDAVSYDGTSIGICQISIANGNSEWLAEKYLHTKTFDLFDTRTNAKMGTAYLADLITQFGDLDIALAAYNWGPEKVKKINCDLTQIPDCVKDYIADVHKYMEEYK